MDRLHKNPAEDLAIFTGAGTALLCIRLHKYTGRPGGCRLPDRPKRLCLYGFWDRFLAFIHNLSKFACQNSVCLRFFAELQRIELTFRGNGYKFIDSFISQMRRTGHDPFAHRFQKAAGCARRQQGAKGFSPASSLREGVPLAGRAGIACNSGRNPTVTGERGGNTGCTVSPAAEWPFLCESGKQSGNAEACRGPESPGTIGMQAFVFATFTGNCDGSRDGGFFHIPPAAFGC